MRGGVIHLVWKVIINAIIVMVCISLVFIGYNANQPMTVTGVPKGMTYVQFIQDRLEAAKAIQPARRGWGMMLSLALIGLIYSVDYTWVAIHPDGFLAKVTAPDLDIPKGVTGASWYEIPGVWWNVVERLSWTMLAKHHPACNLRPVQTVNN